MGKNVFDGPIDLSKHELLNARLQLLFDLPLNPIQGHVCFSTDPTIELGALYTGTKWTFFGLTMEDLYKIKNLPDNTQQEIDDLQDQIDAIVTNGDFVSYVADQSSKTEGERQMARDNIDVYSTSETDIKIFNQKDQFVLKEW